MQHNGILSDEGILPEETINARGKAGRRVHSRTRLSTALFTLIALCVIIVCYRRRDLVEQVNVFVCCIYDMGFTYNSAGL
jgi:hypothetical protein